jgi:hypothetical protein
MTYFYTAKAVDGENVVFANHTRDLDDQSFRDPEGEQPPAGRFQLPPGLPREQIEPRLAEAIKPHALAKPDSTILVRLSEGGQVVFWDVPKTFKC